MGPHGPKHPKKKRLFFDAKSPVVRPQAHKSVPIGQAGGDLIRAATRDSDSYLYTSFDKARALDSDSDKVS